MTMRILANSGRTLELAREALQREGVLDPTHQELHERAQQLVNAWLEEECRRHYGDDYDQPRVRHGGYKAAARRRRQMGLE